jgi:hypothetical protein
MRDPEPATDRAYGRALRERRALEATPRLSFDLAERICYGRYQPCAIAW